MNHTDYTIAALVLGGVVMIVAATQVHAADVRAVVADYPLVDGKRYTIVFAARMISAGEIRHSASSGSE